LQYKLKWETEDYGEQKVEPFLRSLIDAFSKLGYKEPEYEARLIVLIIDGAAMHHYLTRSFDIDRFTEFLITKYEV
jgi:phage gp29-like protein